MPTRRTCGGRGKGKASAKSNLKAPPAASNLKDPPPTERARMPDKKEGEDNEETASEDEIPKTPTKKGNLKDDRKFEEILKTPPPTSKTKDLSDLTKLQDSR